MRLAFLLLIICGCSSLNDITKEISKRETTEHSLQSTDKGSNSYSGDPVDYITVTASGNGSVNLVVGDKGDVQKGEKRDTATEEEIEESFSVDFYLKQVSTAGWALIIFLLICCVVVYIVWVKTTLAGRAFDGATKEGLDLTRAGINKIMSQLADASTGTELHTQLMHELADLKEKEGEYLHRSDKRNK